MKRWNQEDDQTPSGTRRVTSVKFVVSGGFGAGKTTFVGAISEVPPLRTEGAMTSVGMPVDARKGSEDKTTTTVAMDFGRLTVDESLVMYLFGTPGQERFGFMWDNITTGALGAVVLVDTNRLDQSFPAVDHFEGKGIPFVVAVNRFADRPAHPLEDVRAALGVSDGVPVVACDARQTDSARDVLLALLEYLAATRSAVVGV
ncbi:MAG: ATP/GTP-binding protein [Acidimicrobiales bacterium]|nr:ATP/GTP-binding protein [Acidimicrobiales bacterium]